MPYAIFGTCLGAIIGYEIIRVAQREGLPLPVAFFPAAVSPPHLYSVAVMKLYLVNPLKPGERPPQALYDQVLTRLKNWHTLTKEQMIMVRPARLSPSRCLCLSSLAMSSAFCYPSSTAHKSAFAEVAHQRMVPSCIGGVLGGTGLILTDTLRRARVVRAHLRASTVTCHMMGHELHVHDDRL